MHAVGIVTSKCLCLCCFYVKFVLFILRTFNKLTIQDTNRRIYDISYKLSRIHNIFKV